MRRLRSRAFIWVVPLVLGLGLALPVALADVYTTGTNKTLGFSGGTVPNATTFSSPVTFNGSATAATFTNPILFNINSPTLQNISAFGGAKTTWSNTGQITNAAVNAPNYLNTIHSSNSAVQTATVIEAINQQSGTAGYTVLQILSTETGVGSGAKLLTEWKVGSSVVATMQTNGMPQLAGERALNGNYTNSTATFSNTNLSASLINGRTYSFSLALLFDESTVADGFQIDFNGGSATVTDFRVTCIDIANNGVPEALVAATSTTLAGVINDTAMAVSTQYELKCDGTIVPSSTGTFIVRAAQNTHSTGTLTIRRGSWLQIRDANPL